MSAAAFTISAIVCTHDERRFDALERAVASLKSQTRPIEELIVVVDHNPALFELVRTRLSGVIAVENGNTRGLSGARNMGAEAATGDFVAYLDDDATAAPDWIARLARACEDPRVLGAGGRVLPRWLAPRPGWFPDEFLWVVGASYRGMPTVSADVRNLYGGCFCLRRDLLIDVGGFRVELGRVGANRMGCEETELCIRASKERPGSVFRYDPEAVIEHDVPGDRTTWSYFRSRCFGEGVSKARLTRMVGSEAGLASERSHALRALPAGVGRELWAALRRREPIRLCRAGAIVAGLAVTAAGYASERASRRPPG